MSGDNMEYIKGHKFMPNTLKPSNLTTEESIFWKVIYTAAIKSGKNNHLASETAKQAVYDLRKSHIAVMPE